MDKIPVSPQMASLLEQLRTSRTAKTISSPNILPCLKASFRLQGKQLGLVHAFCPRSVDTLQKVPEQRQLSDMPARYVWKEAGRTSQLQSRSLPVISPSQCRLRTLIVLIRYMRLTRLFQLAVPFVNVST